MSDSTRGSAAVGDKALDQSLASTCYWHRLYGRRLERPVFLDTLRPRNPAGSRLDPRGDPDRIHDLRDRPDLGHADRRTLHRPAWSARRWFSFGGFFLGLAWVVNSYAESLTGFYVGAVVGGLGVGAVYATCINNALKWFPDRRGLAVGLTAGGYGSGTILTIIPIANTIAADGYRQAFFEFGLIQGAVIVLIAGFLTGAARQARPPSPTASSQSRRDYTLGRSPSHAGVLGDAGHVHRHGDRRPDGRRPARRHRPGPRREGYFRSTPTSSPWPRCRWRS